MKPITAHEPAALPAALIPKEQLALRLGRSVKAIALAATARNINLIPMPIRIGRRLYWRPEDVDAWIAAQAATNTVKPFSSRAAAPAAPALQPKRRGAPKKSERRAKASAAALAEAQAAQAAQAAQTGEARA